MSINQKRQFVCSCLEQTRVVRIRERSGNRAGKHTHNFKYVFTIDSEKIQVCQKYFLRTLSISQTFVRCTLQNRQGGGVVQSEQRGKKPSIIRIKDEVKNQICQHIMSHVGNLIIAEKTAKKYLVSHLNIFTMHGMYREMCELQGVPPEEIGKEWLYSEIFNTEFILSFAPPKDTCDT